MNKTIWVVGVLALAWASVTEAQVGPAQARVISKQMPSKAPAGATFAAEAELQLNVRGRVDAVEIVTSSGDAAFDKQWRKLLEEWRFVPTVDSNGEPYDSKVRIVYRNTGLQILPEAPRGAGTAPLPAEGERIDRMTCEDFLWEYVIIANTLPRRLVLLDPLVKTPLLMLAASTNVTPEQMKGLQGRYDQLVRDAAEQCRDNLQTPFWKGLFKPLLETNLADPTLLN